MSLLRLRNLRVSIHGKPVLNGVNLGLFPGEIVGLIGESGSGKSMTALSVLRLLPEGTALSGEIRFEGQDIADHSERQMQAIRGGRIGMVFQEPMTALNPLKTIGAQVAETARVHQRLSRTAAMRLARETLDRVELPGPRFGLDLYPHELSGGQRQRVAIAMAIALRPALLIADEPTTALDVTTQAQVLALLGRLAREDGMGLLFITHDLGLAALMADRVAIMKAGEIVEEGPTVPLFRALRQPYSQALLAAAGHRPARQVPPSDEAPVVLEVQGLRRVYPLSRESVLGPRRDLVAVRDVSFSIRQGETVGLVGESGSGKSTLARAIMGLDPLKAGTIRIMGQAFGPVRPSRATRRQVQVVFQDPYGSFNPRHRVERLIAEPFYLLGRKAPRGRARLDAIIRALEDVGLSGEDRHRHIQAFSGGERQRIAIARALIIEPRLIILDEAVSALDVSIRAQILDLLADLAAKKGVSYLFISHDLSVVRAITQRVLVMKSGEIVEAGATEAVFSNPGHPYTAELLAASPDLERALRERERASGAPAP